MSIDHSYRYRVSSTLIGIKIAIIILLGISAAGITFNIVQHKFNPTVLIPSLVALLLYLLTKGTKTFEYNSINHILYITEPKKDELHIIPVENIDSIQVKGYAFAWASFYYVIICRNAAQQQNVRFFPIPFRNDIETIAIDTTLKIQMRSWIDGD